MVEVWLPYGKTEVCARIPTRNYLGNIEPKEKTAVADATMEIEKALKNPIGTKPLAEIAKKGGKAVIVVDDHTRSTQSHLMVPPILNELNSAGIKDDDITIIFACGTHRAVKPEEMKKLVGEEVVNRIKTISHDCKAKDMVHLGKTKTYGTEVYINKTFIDADVRILTGDLCLHYYAGYGGGRKSILPGISGVETIQHNHALLLDPKARTGNIDGNPVHEDMVEAAKLVKVDFVLNIVTNSKKELVQAFAGDLNEVFNAGVSLVDGMYKVPIEQRTDIVVVSSGGHPHDINLFQAYKGVDNALNAAKRGGVIVLVAECPEGHGNDVFYEWTVKFKNLKDMEKEIKHHFVLGGHKSYYLLKALQRVQIILVSVMPDYEAVNVFNLKTGRAVNDALRDAFRIAGQNAKVLTIPHGNITLPIVKAVEEKT